jgi:hypothetical protein
MLVHNKLEDPDSRIGGIRSQIQEQLDSLSFAGRLWQIFRAIISRTLNKLQATLGCSVDNVMLTIDKRINGGFGTDFRHFELRNLSYNYSRVHASLKGDTPAQVSVDPKPGKLIWLIWQTHCRELVQLPVAA